MTNEQKQLPLKCTWKQLRKSYERLALVIIGGIAVNCTAAILYLVPVAVALCFVIGQFVNFVNPVIGQLNANMTTAVSFTESVIVAVWLCYIVIVMVGTFEMYIYAHTRVNSELNRLSAYFDKIINPNKEPTPFIADKVVIDIEWVKNTLFESLIMNPSMMIISFVAVLMFMIARFGIQSVICVTVLLKSIWWAQDTFPAMKDPNSPVVFMVIVVICILTTLLALVLDPAVACLATNLNVNVKMLDR